MTQHRNLDYGQRLPEAVLDALQEYISTLLVNFTITISAPTTLLVAAGTGNAQVGAGIMGRWRWITSNVSAAHPAGAAAQYDVFLTASDNSFAGTPEVDSTVYTFGMVILASGGTPGTALYRKVAETTWDGTKITRVVLKAGGIPNDLDLNTLKVVASIIFPDGSVQSSAGGRAGANSALLATMMNVEGVNPGISGDVRTALAPSWVSGMTVRISPGGALVQGTDAVGQGMYAYLLAANSDFVAPAAHATLPRVDSIYVQANDAQHTARVPLGTGLIYVSGTATSGATLANRTGAPGGAGGPAAPPSALRLSDVLVPAAAGVLSAASIGDVRKPSGPAIWGEDGHRYRLGVNASGTLGVEQVV